VEVQFSEQDENNNSKNTSWNNFRVTFKVPKI